MAVVVLAGCAVVREPLTADENADRAKQDMAALFGDQEPLTAPLGLYEAMARGVKYNMDHRLKLMEAALSERQLTTSNLSMLPALTAKAGYEGRNNQSASSSRSSLTNIQSLETSMSQDRERAVYDYGLSWNVLDFGVSYVRAQQEADRGLIVEERRRKVVHNIVQDVRSSYWQAVAAERLLKRLDPLQARIDQALASSRTIETQGLKRPLDALVYRRQLLEMLRQVKQIRRELVGAKIQLAALMGLKPGQEFQLAVDEGAFQEPQVGIALPDLERAAMLSRPELREETYQGRIAEKDIKRAMLQMLPGITLDGRYNYDSNSYTESNHWWSYVAKVNFNLFDTFLNGPARIRESEGAKDVAHTRRLALSIAVMSQVHVSWRGYQQAVSEFRTATELNQVESAILDQTSAAQRTERSSEMELISAEVNSVLAELRRDMAFADVTNAMGRVFLTAGADPLPAQVDGHDIPTLARAIKTSMERWREGKLVSATAEDLEAERQDKASQKVEVETAPLNAETPVAVPAFTPVAVPVPVAAAASAPPVPQPSARLLAMQSPAPAVSRGETLDALIVAAAEERPANAQALSAVSSWWEDVGLGLMQAKGR
ncbi:MAG: TolC family protein [Rhodospirillaceae bacterium]|nr:TolC family protein [Rhodospirillales bacterium]